MKNNQYHLKSQKLLSFIKQWEFNDSMFDDLTISKESGKIIVKGNRQLKVLIAFSMLLWGYKSDLNFLDVSLVEDFSDLFADVYSYVTMNPIEFEKFLSNGGDKKCSGVFWAKALTLDLYINTSMFNGIIDEWDLRKGEKFSHMFKGSNFNNHDLILDLPLAENLQCMFEGVNINKKIVLKLRKDKYVDVLRLFYKAKIEDISLDLSICDKVLLCFRESDLSPSKLKNIIFPNKDYFLERNISLDYILSLENFGGLKEQDCNTLFNLIHPLNLKDFLKIVFKTNNQMCNSIEYYQKAFNLPMNNDARLALSKLFCKKFLDKEENFEEQKENPVFLDILRNHVLNRVKLTKRHLERYKDFLVKNNLIDNALTLNKTRKQKERVVATQLNQIRI